MAPINMVCAIIQARMGSTRLPKKVLMEVNGRPLLSYMIERVKAAHTLDRIIVATTDLERDDKIAGLCKEEAVEYFRGSESDVLSRYYQCAIKAGAETIVRLTADCPLIDPRVIDKVVSYYLDNSYDFVGNTVPPPSSYPDGMDVEVFNMGALEKSHKEARLQPEREHVTYYMWKTNKFRAHRIDHIPDWSKHRFTVDYPGDFELVKRLLEALYSRRRLFSVEDLVAYENKRKGNPASI